MMIILHEMDAKVFKVSRTGFKREVSQLKRQRVFYWAWGGNGGWQTIKSSLSVSIALGSSLLVPPLGLL